MISVNMLTNFIHVPVLLLTSIVALRGPQRFHCFHADKDQILSGSKVILQVILVHN